MSRPVEHSNSTRGGGTFPESWGPPQGRPGSEERTAWIRTQVRRFAGVAARRRLAESNGRLLAILRAAELQRRERGPDA